MTGLALARLRAQPGQAVLVGALSAVLALTAVLGLAYAGAVEESVQRTVLAAAPIEQSGVSVTVDAAAPPSPAQLREKLQPEISRPTWGAPVLGAQAGGMVATSDHPLLVPVVSREGACEHLRMASGRCADGAGQVVVSRSTAAQAGLHVGSTFAVADSSVGFGSRPALPRLTVVGVYEQATDLTTYWFDRSLVASAPDTGDVRSGEAMVVGWPTLQSGHWRSVAVSADVPLDAERLTVERAASARADLDALEHKASSVNADSTSQLGSLLDSSATQRRQARTPLPLLALQGLLLALVVLVYVAAATTEQRRADVALARLRGQLPSRAARMLVRDLAGVVLLGAVIGGALGWLLARVAAAHWLAPGVPVPVRWPLGVAVFACAVVAMAAVTVTAVPTVREPLVTLLRAVPPRSSAVRAGIADGAVVALCVAGLVTLLGDDASSPTALVAPGLLALAGGLLLSQVVVPAAGALGRRLLARGRLAPGLAGVAVSRRPALRRLVAIETVAVALLVFAGAAGAVGSAQRTEAAQRSVGAPVVLSVQGGTPTELVDVVHQVDPSGSYAAPAVVAHPASGTGTSTLAVDPARFARVALWGSSGEPGADHPDLRALSPHVAAPVTFTGRRLTVDATFSWRGYQPTIAELQGSAPPPVGVRKPTRLVAQVVDEHGTVATVDLGAFPRGHHVVTASVPCAAGCRLRSITLQREERDLGAAVLDLRLDAVSADGHPVDLRGTDRGWALVGYLDKTQVSATDGHLEASAKAIGSSLELLRLDVPSTAPVLATAGLAATPYGALPVDGDSGDPGAVVSGPALGGSDGSYLRRGSLPRVPGVPSPAVLVSLGSVGQLEGALSSTAQPQVWLSADDPAREKALVQRLAARGVTVLDRTSVADVAHAAASRGTALSLHLATVVGVVALLLAASVLAVAVATSGRVRAYDLAGLAAVGVPRRVLARAAVLEQLVVAVVGVVCGGVLGLAGALLTLSHGPRDTGLPTPRVVSGVPSAVVLTVISAVVLLAVCVALGTRLARQARPGLLREGVR